MLACVLLWGFGTRAHAMQHTRIAKDEVGLIYARERFVLDFERLMSRVGEYVAPAPLDHHAVPSDTLPAWIMAVAARIDPDPDPEPTAWQGLVRSVFVVQPEQAESFAELFLEMPMAFLGNDMIAATDTTATRQLRAMMQHTFGDPTRTIADLDLSDPSVDFIQFEYWIVVNDTIPVIIMDARGPFDRGVVLAGAQAYRDQLRNVRQSLLGRMMREALRSAYVDYYFDPGREQWYRTGYDGAGYFTEPIGTPDLRQGRPVLPGQDP